MAFGRGGYSEAERVSLSPPAFFYVVASRSGRRRQEGKAKTNKNSKPAGRGRTRTVKQKSGRVFLFFPPYKTIY